MKIPRQTRFERRSLRSNHVCRGIVTRRFYFVGRQGLPLFLRTTPGTMSGLQDSGVAM